MAQKTEKYTTLNSPGAPLERHRPTLPANEILGSGLLDFIPHPMLISSPDGDLIQLNDAYTEHFGWTMHDLEGDGSPSFQDDIKGIIAISMKDLPKGRSFRIETTWHTRAGGVLDVDITGRALENINGSPGVALIIRDITQEKKAGLINDTLLRISTALPAHPVLEDLMDYISSEISCLLNSSGAFVLIPDEESKELFFQGVGTGDSITGEQLKKIRVPMHKSITGKVIRTGTPLIIHDTSTDPDYYSEIDTRTDIRIKDMIIVPLRNSDRIIGALCAINKTQGRFNDTDLELLTMIAGTVALSIENARFSGELKEAYDEVSSLNRAKDRVINHLSHELKTPVSVLLASIGILERRFGAIPEADWSPTLERARRNLDRLLELQYELEDIMQNKDFRSYSLLSFMLEECADELEALIAEETGERDVVQRIRGRIEEIFGPDKDEIIEKSDISALTTDTLNALRPRFSHRDIEISVHAEKTSEVHISKDALKKIIEGLIKNALENTPDEGRIDISVTDEHDGVRFTLKDYGVGIMEEDQKRIFEGFYPVQETMDYSSKRPFDFNAGGKGADLLRARIFSERYNFNIMMESSRCRFIPRKDDICPGRISRCIFCNSRDDCQNSGGTVFRLFFPMTADDEMP